MALVVWKFRVEPHRSTVTMPEGGQVVAAGEQLGALFVWALVDPHARTVDRPIRVAMTGDGVDPRWHHIATVQLSTGFVLHLFDPTRPIKGL